MKNIDTFLNTIRQNNLPSPTEAQIKQLQTYVDLLIKWNKSINLIGKSTVPDIWTRHLLDAWQLIPHLPAKGNILDIGSGAGIPAIIIAIACPHLHVDACEINGKKASFMNTAKRSLGLSNFTVRHDDVANLEQTAPPYTLITARAYATVTDILTQTKVLIDKDSHYLLPKGETWEKEILTAKQIYNMTTKTFSSITNVRGKLVHIAHAQVVPREAKT